MKQANIFIALILSLSLSSTLSSRTSAIDPQLQTDSAPHCTKFGLTVDDVHMNQAAFDNDIIICIDATSQKSYATTKQATELIPYIYGSIEPPHFEILRLLEDIKAYNIPADNNAPTALEDLGPAVPVQAGASDPAIKLAVKDPATTSEITPAELNGAAVEALLDELVGIKFPFTDDELNLAGSFTDSDPASFKTLDNCPTGYGNIVVNKI